MAPSLPEQVKQGPKPHVGHRASDCGLPFGGLKAVPFVEAVDKLQVSVQELIPGDGDVGVVRQAAVAAVLAGFRSVEHLGGLPIDEIKVISLSPAVVALLKMLLPAVNARFLRKRKLQDMAVRRYCRWLPASGSRMPLLLRLLCRL